MTDSLFADVRLFPIHHPPKIYVFNDPCCPLLLCISQLLIFFPFLPNGIPKVLANWMIPHDKNAVSVFTSFLDRTKR